MPRLDAYFKVMPAPPWSTVPLWSLTLPLLSLTALMAAPPERRLYTALAAATAYTASQWLAPSCRLRLHPSLTPVKLSMLLFLLKLVVLPTLLMTTIPALGVLAAMPSHASMEWMLVIDLVAFVAFCLAVGLAPAAPVHKDGLLSILARAPSRSTIFSFAALGVLGLGLTFGSFGGLTEYFLHPSSNAEIDKRLEGTWRGLIGTFLQPFLAFSFILLWSRAVDRGGRHGVGKTAALTALTIIGITFANLTFSFNRAAFVFPVFCVVAVFSSRVRRIPLWWLAAVVAAVAPALLMIGDYRSTPMYGSEFVSDPGSGHSSLQDLSDEVQVYGSAPQFPGYVLEQLGWGDKLYRGSTLVASVLSPMPVLGKSFRELSGATLYNRVIYGVPGIEDQIIPFSTELFLNFHVAGVAVGFFLLGLFVGTAERRFEAAGSCFAAFAIQYVALWAAVMCIWSLAVFSQILIYFCGPIYLYIAVGYLAPWARSLNRRTSATSRAGAYA